MTVWLLINYFSDNCPPYQGIAKTATAWKMFVLGVILVRIFPHSDRIRENTDQNSSEYVHFLRSEVHVKLFPWIYLLKCVWKNYIQINWYFCENKFSPYLCGVWKNHNAQYSLLKMIWRKLLENGEKVGTFFMDLSKAFYAINTVYDWQN